MCDGEDHQKPASKRPKLHYESNEEGAQHRQQTREEPADGTSDGAIRKIVIGGGKFSNLNFGTQINYHFHGPNSEISSLQNDQPKASDTEEFLRRVKIHFNKTVGDSSNLTSLPIIMMLDMGGSKQSNSRNAVRGDTDILFGRDIKPIRLDELHDHHNGKLSRHVMILGEAGAGKTTLTKMYSARAAEGNINSIDNIELVYLVNAMFLQCDSLSTAFDLIFTQQMSGDTDTELNPEVERAGERWINENADKILIAIDGLDQLMINIGGQRHPNIKASTPSRTDHILACIMSGKIWRGARVLTSSRWNIYWNLMASEKPDKVIGLRGFNDENMRNAIMFQMKDRGESETLLHDLQSTPKLLALCRNPLFLQYTSKIYQNNANKMPDSISGLLSALFVEFIHSGHSSKPELDGLTKLAYELTLENRFYSTLRYLKKLKVDPDRLKGFLSSGTNLPPGQEIPIPDDETFVFTHQALQEFCCALHIVNLDPNEVRNIAATTLQESKMEMTRKLFYGVILDDRNTDQLRRYLEDRSCAIDECRDILFNQLLALIPESTINDIKVIHLLAECGNATIQMTKDHVRTIRIKEHGLLTNDQITLATIIKQLSPLNNVYILDITFNESLDAYLKDSPQHAESFRVYRLTLQDRALTREKIDLFLTALCEVGCKSMGLTSCSLTEEKLHLITERCNALEIKLKRLAIYEDEDMPVAAYKNVSLLLHATQCKQMAFANCNLSSSKLHLFGCGCSEIGVKLTELCIIDKFMPADAFKECATALHVTQCTEVYFSDCNLTVQKLTEFQSGCLREGLSLSILVITDDTMPENAYREVSKTLHATGCTKVDFTYCALSVSKLSAFDAGCKKHNLSLDLIVINDERMSEDGYRELVSSVRTTKCPVLTLEHFFLSKEKLLAFRSECQKQNIQMNKLLLNEIGNVAPDVIVALCELMTDVVKSLEMSNCQIYDEGRQTLKDTFHLPNIKAKSLKLPNEDFICKPNATQEKPSGNPDQFGSSVDSVRTDTKPNVIASSDGTSVD